MHNLANKTQRSRYSLFNATALITIYNARCADLHLQSSIAWENITCFGRNFIVWEKNLRVVISNGGLSFEIPISYIKFTCRILALKCISNLQPIFRSFHFNRKFQANFIPLRYMILNAFRLENFDFWIEYTVVIVFFITF